MAAGDFLSPSDHRAIQRAVATAQVEAEAVFTVCIDQADGPSRPYAEKLHGRLATPDDSILVFLDPVARALEIVTGPGVRRRLDDSEVALAALAMQTSFAAGDFVGGITQGLQQLADHARRPRTLHFDPR